MASNKSKRHTHKYHKVALSPSNKVWACALPDCQHHMPPNYAKLVEGKMSYCWKCDSEMTLNPENMKMDKPLCDDCSGLNDLNNEILKELGL